MTPAAAPSSATAPAVSRRSVLTGASGARRRRRYADSTGCGPTSTKTPYRSAAHATARSNRTGRVRFAAQYSASSSVTSSPVTVEIIGRAASCTLIPASAARSCSAGATIAREW